MTALAAPLPVRLARLVRIEHTVFALPFAYVGALLGWRPGPFDGKLCVVESEEGRRRGAGAAWGRLAAESEVVRVPGDHESFILEHGQLVAAALGRWLEPHGEESTPHG